MLDILLIQLFWFSFCVIGFMEVKLCIAVCSRVRNSPFVSFLRSTHKLSAAFILWSIGAGTLLLYIIPAYIFEWPMSILGLFYFLLVIMTVIFFIRRRTTFIKIFKQQLFMRRSNVHIVFIVAAALIFNYSISLKSGGPLSGDAQVFIGKIYQLANSGHFTLADASFGKNGVVQPGYSTNFLFGLQALLSHILHITAYRVWLYSNAFQLLLIWLSFFFSCLVVYW
jgi:hypothetical protein